MKIKAVCEMTNLSDRTIRYYIEQNLISPAYTENYLGRKNFEFTKENVDELNDIAVLRKFNFTIQEIRDILISPANSRQIVHDVQARARQSVTEGQATLTALTALDTEQLYTVSEIAHILETFGKAKPLQNDFAPKSIKETLRKMLKPTMYFLATWLPIIISLTAAVLSFTQYVYPKINYGILALMLIPLLPSVFMLMMPKFKKLKKTDVLKQIMVLLCVLSIPINFFLPLFLVTKSETTDIYKYRKLDVVCHANQARVFQELFPFHPHLRALVTQPNGERDFVDLNAVYHYRYWTPTLDYTYDVYAEWSLQEKEYYEEIERVRLVFEKFKTKEYNLEPLETEYEYFETKTEQYDCWILYTGDTPFQEVTGDYEYAVFAFNEAEHRVRYVYCRSLDGTVRPYYLELEW